MARKLNNHDRNDNMIDYSITWIENKYNISITPFVIEFAKYIGGDRGVGVLHLMKFAEIDDNKITFPNDGRSKGHIGIANFIKNNYQYDLNKFSKKKMIFPQIDSNIRKYNAN